jgi:hypothetical protein
MHSVLVHSASSSGLDDLAGHTSDSSSSRPVTRGRSDSLHKRTHDAHAHGQHVTNVAPAAHHDADTNGRSDAHPKRDRGLFLRKLNTQMQRWWIQISAQAHTIRQKRIVFAVLCGCALFVLFCISAVSFNASVRLYHSMFSDACDGVVRQQFQLPRGNPRHPSQCPAHSSHTCVTRNSTTGSQESTDPGQSNCLVLVVPNYVHFVYGLGPVEEFPLLFHLSLASAVNVQKAERVYFHYNRLPTGQWWDRSVEVLGSHLVLHQVPNFDTIFGQPITHYAHKSDVIRLQALIEHGGIYVDLDVIFVRPLTLLRQFHLVMGEEAIAPGWWNAVKTTVGIDSRMEWYARARGINGMANAVIVSEPNNPFVTQWYESYREFEQERWSEQCCEVPLKMANNDPTALLRLSSDSFFLPQYEQLESFFTEDRWDFEGNWLVHMWHHKSETTYLPLYVENLEDILNEDHPITSFKRVARAALKGPRNLKNPEQQAQALEVKRPHQLRKVAQPAMRHRNR